MVLGIHWECCNVSRRGDRGQLYILYCLWGKKNVPPPTKRKVLWQHRPSWLIYSPILPVTTDYKCNEYGKKRRKQHKVREHLSGWQTLQKILHISWVYQGSGHTSKLQQGSQETDTGSTTCQELLSTDRILTCPYRYAANHFCLNSAHIHHNLCMNFMDRNEITT